MALTATVVRVLVSVSDVDRGVYETLDLRLAQHPSETSRYLVTRLLAYCLSYEEGIAFSKGGLSDVDEPAISVRDPTGLLLAWIEVGAPSAERLHRASKAARRVEVYTSQREAVKREAMSREIHKADAIDVWTFDVAFLDALAAKMDRSTKLDLTRNEGELYATLAGASTPLTTTLLRTNVAALSTPAPA